MFVYVIKSYLYALFVKINWSHDKKNVIAYKFVHVIVYTARNN